MRVGMAVFTMIMGNAFAAITVMTVGIGAPFVLSLGAGSGRGRLAGADLRLLRDAVYPDGGQLQHGAGRRPGDEGQQRRHQEAGARRCDHARIADHLHDRHVLGGQVMRKSAGHGL